jgi:tetratricopeptide (TPR) repeat protein
LILRRVTPDLIEKVLAEPCGVQVESAADAQRLFTELSQEQSLVQVIDPDEVRPRPDLRSVMLRLLQSDQSEKVRDIHQRAVDYYAVRSELDDRAEEIYHRLALNQDSKVIDERWTPGVESFLSDAIDELPPRAQAYLGARLGIELDDHARNQADLQDWELDAERRAREYLRVDRPHEVLSVLAERSDRTEGSRLYPIEAEALQRLGQWSEAFNVLQSAMLSSTQPFFESPLMLDLLALSAISLENLGEFEAALDALSKAGAIAGRLGDDRRLLEIELSRLRLVREGGSEVAGPDSTQAEIEVSAVRAFGRISDAELRQQSGLLRAAAASLGANRPDVLTRMARLDALGSALVAHPGDLADIVPIWNASLPADAKETFKGFAGPGDSDTPPDFSHGASMSALATIIDRIAQSQPINPDVAERIAAILQQPAPPMYA